MNKLTDTFILSNGYPIPCVGFGTWQTPDGEIAANAVKCAIQSGYRHIDAAAIYGNEVSVGQGIAESGVAREELFITSKVWNTERGYEKTMAAFEKTLKDLEGKIDSSDKAAIESKLEELKNVAKGSDIQAIKDATDALQKAFYAVSEKLYQQANPQGGCDPNCGGNCGNDGVVDADYETVD